MNNNTITPQDYQKLRDNLPKDRQESLYRLDEVEAYELHDKLEDEKAKISKANKQIESSQ
jgi:hypothetical protein